MPHEPNRYILELIVPVLQLVLQLVLLCALLPGRATAAVHAVYGF